MSNETEFLRQHIKSLIVNLPLSIPKQISLVFDGGAFNGGFGAGVGLYLKEMERHGLLQIKRISGCSVGALLAVWYMMGCDERFMSFAQRLYTSVRTTLNLTGYNNTIGQFIYDLIPSDEDVHKFHKKLYINYYDTRSRRQRVISKFRDRKHLVTCLVRSGFIPYLSDNKARCNGRYVDGITPYLLRGDPNTLFVNLITPRKLSRAFKIKSEQDVHYRLLVGVSDANEFFTTGASDMCTYVDQWSWYMQCFVGLRLWACLILLGVLEWLLRTSERTPQRIKDHPVCHKIRRWLAKHITLALL